MNNLLNTNELTNGTIIISVVTSFPILKHYGVIYIENNELFILHNSPTLINEFGGNILKEKLNDFLIDRKIIGIEKHNIHFNILKENYETLKLKKFNLLEFNCETFVNIITNSKTSKNVLFKTVTVITILLLYGSSNSKRDKINKP